MACRACQYGRMHYSILVTQTDRNGSKISRRRSTWAGLSWFQLGTWEPTFERESKLQCEFTRHETIANPSGTQDSGGGQGGCLEYRLNRVLFALVNGPVVARNCSSRETRLRFVQSDRSIGKRNTATRGLWGCEIAVIDPVCFGLLLNLKQGLRQQKESERKNRVGSGLKTSVEAQCPHHPSTPPGVGLAIDTHTHSASRRNGRSSVFGRRRGERRRRLGE